MITLPTTAPGWHFIFTIRLTTNQTSVTVTASGAHLTGTALGLTTAQAFFSQSNAVFTSAAPIGAIITLTGASTPITLMGATSVNGTITN